MPKGYVIAEVEVNDPSGYEEYRAKVLAVVTAYGGKYLVRGGDALLLEGTGEAGRIVVVEFDSPEQALVWYRSPEYQSLLKIRLRYSTGRALCVSGAPQP